MRSVLLLTDLPFWRKDSGACTRIAHLVKYISPEIDLTVIYIGLPIYANEVEILSNYKCKFHSIEKNENLTSGQYCHRLKTFLKQRVFDFCIVEYIHNTLYLECIEKSTKLILDIHDIMSERSGNFRSHHNHDESFEISQEMEYRVYDFYDHIIVLCEADYQKLKRVIDPNKLLLCSHPGDIVTKIIRSEVKIIGFVGSGYLPNVDAINFFLKECWPLITETHNVALNIYGNVIYRLENAVQTSTIKFKGFVEDINDIYEECDIMINPVRFGAGIKIKNIEALSHGLPLITTAHGSRGLEKGVNVSFLVADSPIDINNCLVTLIKDYDLRKRLSCEACKFIAETFSADKCFGPLIRLINVA